MTTSNTIAVNYIAEGGSGGPVYCYEASPSNSKSICGAIMAAPVNFPGLVGVFGDIPAANQPWPSNTTNPDWTQWGQSSGGHYYDWSSYGPILTAAHNSGTPIIVSAYRAPNYFCGLSDSSGEPNSWNLSKYDAVFASEIVYICKTWPGVAAVIIGNEFKGIGDQSPTTANFTQYTNTYNAVANALTAAGLGNILLGGPYFWSETQYGASIYGGGYDIAPTGTYSGAVVSYGGFDLDPNVTNGIDYFIQNAVRIDIAATECAVDPAGTHCWNYSGLTNFFQWFIGRFAYWGKPNPVAICNTEFYGCTTGGAGGNTTGKADYHNAMSAACSGSIVALCNYWNDHPNNTAGYYLQTTAGAITADGSDIAAYWSAGNTQATFPTKTAPVQPSGIAPPTGNLTNWTLQHTEDFSGSSVPANWSVYNIQDASYPHSYYLSSHVSVANSCLQLAGYHDTAAPSTCPYATAGVQYAGLPQAYGKYILMAKLDSCDIVKIRAGLYPSTATDNAEIDFWEDNGGNRTSATSYVHEYSSATPYPDTTVSASWSYVGGNWTEIGVEWSPNGIDVVVGSTTVASWSSTTLGSGLPDENMNLFFQLECVSASTTSSTPATMSLLVDWVAIYSWSGGGGGSTGSAPAVPAAATATLGSDSKSVVLNWTAVTGSPAAASYNVLDSTGTNVIASGITGTTYTVPNLAAGTYSYTLESVSSTGVASAASPASNSVTVPSSTAYQTIKLVQQNSGKWDPAATSGTLTVAWSSGTNTDGNDVVVEISAYAQPSPAQTFTVTAPTGFVLIDTASTVNTPYLAVYRYPGAPATASWDFTVSSNYDLYMGWTISERSGVDSTVAASAVQAVTVTTAQTSTTVTGTAPTGAAATNGVVYLAASSQAPQTGTQASSIGIGTSSTSWTQETANTDLNGGELAYLWSQPASSSAPSATLTPTNSNYISAIFYALTPASEPAPSTPAAPTAALGSDNTSAVITWGALEPYAAWVDVYGPGGVSVASDQTGTSFTLTGLAPGTYGPWTIKMVGPGGTSAMSPASGTVDVPVIYPAPAQPPAPTVALGSNQQSAQISWTYEANATTCNVFRAPAGSTTFVELQSGALTSPYTDGTVAPGQSYQWTMTQTGPGGVSPMSPPSATLAIPSLAPPPKPSTPTVSAYEDPFDAFTYAPDPYAGVEIAVQTRRLYEALGPIPDLEG